MKEYMPYILEAINELQLYVEKYYAGKYTKDLEDVKNVLSLFLLEIEKSNYPINIRVIRAMKDIGTFAARELEHSKLGNDIGKITEKLYYEYPGYKELELLRMDFGKGFPI